MQTPERGTSCLRCAMLSYRWEGHEPLLHDILDKIVYELIRVGDIVKLQSFCKLPCRRMLWVWSDPCCIDKSNNIELQESSIHVCVVLPLSACDHLLIRCSSLVQVWLTGKSRSEYTTMDGLRIPGS
ncbi:hypothetical protein BDR05DRAFT_708108 [Suillus weaverae]|nr:hypothetical protein BDR05DRAFT_708108 [Suillus weaverae]